MEKSCSKCKKTFACQNEMRGCWCETVSLSHKTLFYLKEHFENCLCPGCLKQFEQDELKSLLNENK